MKIGSPLCSLKNTQTADLKPPALRILFMHERALEMVAPERNEIEQPGKFRLTVRNATPLDMDEMLLLA